jgi:outer membrane murein-binding lipoprotein Lpp
MKKTHAFLIAAAIVSFVLSGCASQTESVVQSSNDATTKRVHTQEELQKSGESETGPALEKTDAAIQTSTRR